MVDRMIDIWSQLINQSSVANSRCSDRGRSRSSQSTYIAHENSCPEISPSKAHPKKKIARENVNLPSRAGHRIDSGLLECRCSPAVEALVRTQLMKLRKTLYSPKFAEYCCSKYSPKSLKRPDLCLLTEVCHVVVWVGIIVAVCLFPRGRAPAFSALLLTVILGLWLTGHGCPFTHLELYCNQLPGEPLAFSGVTMSLSHFYGDLIS